MNCLDVYLSPNQPDGNVIEHHLTHRLHGAHIQPQRAASAGGTADPRVGHSRRALPLPGAARQAGR